jgi:hypothetical protein
MTNVLKPEALTLASSLAPREDLIDGQSSLVFARSFAEIDELALDWQRLASTPAVDLELYRATAESAPGFVRPHLVLARRGDRPVALLAARLERIRLPLKLGYRRLWQPYARCLTVEHGACVGDLSEANAAVLLRALLDSLRSGEADVALLHQLPLESPLLALARRLPPRLCRDGCATKNVRWVLRLPKHPEEPLTISGHTRGLARYYTKRLIRKYGDQLRFELYRDVADFERMIADVETIAARTYQRALGVGFAADATSRRRFRRQMERGTLRCFVLYCGGRPAAFWIGFRHGDVYYAESTGYDPEFAPDHVGKVLLARKIDSLRAEGDIGSVDFGFGDADYKHHWANERVDEQTLAIFAPSVFGLSLNVMRTVAGRADVWSRRVARRLGVFERLRSRERQRFASGTPGPGEARTETSSAADASTAGEPTSSRTELADDRPIGGAMLAAFVTLIAGLFMVSSDESGAGAVVVVVLALAVFESWLRGWQGRRRS